MKLRLDQIAYMTIAAHLIHFILHYSLSGCCAFLSFFYLMPHGLCDESWFCFLIIYQMYK